MSSFDEHRARRDADLACIARASAEQLRVLGEGYAARPVLAEIEAESVERIARRVLEMLREERAAEGD
ncbi:MAG: hypothetical protein KGH75_00975 [Rhodospirillales bacterium]|nr:hypothetical protein [Rhodospirillales bacterium]